MFYCIKLDMGIITQLIIKHLTLCELAWQKGYQLNVPQIKKLDNQCSL